MFKLFFLISAVLAVSAFAKSQNVCNSGSTTYTVVKLLTSRVAIADKVAAAKWVSQSPIDDPVREKQILDNVETRANNIKISSAWAKAFFNDQFAATKTVQRELHNLWTKEGEVKGKSSAKIPKIDLAKEVRPDIDDIDNQLFDWFKYNLNNCNYQPGLLNNIVKACFKLNTLHYQAFEIAIKQLKKCSKTG